MKKQILLFVRFYLTMPMLVILIGIIGTVLIRRVDASAYIIKEEIPEDTRLSFEDGLFPVEALDELLFMPDNYRPIIARTVKGEEIFNETSYAIDKDEILGYLPRYKITDEPLVLVIHTHGTESYLEGEVRAYYSDSSTTVEAYYDPENTKTRTEDTERNVVAVGKAFCEVLENRGVPVIHCTEMFDLEDYNTSYSKSARAIEEYLETYPSIRLVIDLHRDSLISGDLTKIKTVAGELDSRSAQVMIVAGSDAGGSVYKSWKRNLALDIKIKEVMDKSYPSLSRPILLRGARYNQHLAYSSFLLEVCTCANTLDEAKTAAALCAECVAEVILNP